MRRVGIYPGSFDPMHQGHLAFAELALSAGKLDEVVFLPEEKPRGKPRISPLAVRLQELRLKTNQSEQLSVMSLPIERFTVTDTLEVLQAEFRDAHLTLLVGSDIVRTFQYRWPDLDRLVRTTDLIIGLRDNDTAQDVEAQILSIESEFGYRLTYSIVATPYAHLASSRIKRGGIDGVMNNV